MTRTKEEEFPADSSRGLVVLAIHLRSRAGEPWGTDFRARIAEEARRSQLLIAAALGLDAADQVEVRWSMAWDGSKKRRILILPEEAEIV